MHFFCCFPIEIKVRELDSRIYLALKLMQKSDRVGCLVGHKSGVHNSMFKFNRPVIYFPKGMSEANGSLYNQIRQSNGLILYLDEEGNIFKEGDHKWFQMRYTPQIRQYIDKIFAWGTKQKAILTEIIGIDDDKILVTGNPRFDLRKKEFSAFYHTLNSDKFLANPFILVNSNFYLSNGFLTYDESFKLFKQIEDSRTEGGFDRSTFDLAYQFQKEMLEAYVDLVITLSSLCPNTNIVVRPHPVENNLFYIDKFRDIPNVKVIQEGSVQELIVKSRMVIHPDCTTAVEAFFFGRNIYSYIPVNPDNKLTQGHIESTPINISEKIIDQGNMIRAVKKNFEAMNYYQYSNEKRQHIASYLKEIYANFDFNSAEKIAGETLKLSEQKIGNNDVSESVDLSIFPYHKQYSGFKQKLKTWIGKIRTPGINHTVDRSYKNIKFPGLDYNEIQRKVKLFREVDPDLPEVKINQIDRDTFLFRRK